MPTISDTIAANGSKRFNVSGKFFALIRADYAPARIRFFNRFAELDSVELLEAGLKYNGDIHAVEIFADTLGCDFQFYIGENEVEYNRGAASVDVNSLPAPVSAMTQSAAAVTTSSAQLVAAKSDRRFLLIQNNDASATVYLNVAGAAATTAGLKLAPGASVIFDVCAPSAAIFAIASANTAANAVAVIEG